LPRISGIGRHDLADMCLDGFPHFAKALRGPAQAMPPRVLALCISVPGDGCYLTG